ncbi:embryo-specific protein ATS3A-like [Magnolia sinica]|uniref:embryo-specific protein ATS3A-like n=1 Tax=Magnolia sinica TaxID=86752 RepID=UPI00265A1D18|nr:embryo-specific protein ATS3A-like [Magnolia sinica]
MLRGRKMMGKSRAAIAFWVFYLASEMVGFSRGDGLYAEKQKSCTYTIMVETTCTQGAGTSDHISLRFGDSNSSDVLVHHLNTKHLRRVDGEHTTVLDDVPRQPFRACNVDQFHVTGPCMESPVCYLFLKQRGKDGWRPGMVQVLVPGTSPYSSHTFYFRRYLPWNVWHGSDSCDTKVTPFGIKHTRKMFGDKNKLVTKVLF